MRDFGIEFTETKLVVLDCGLGDHCAFKTILPELQTKYKDLVLAVCYPELFKNDNNRGGKNTDKDIKIISIADAKAMGDIGKYSIYKFMWDNTDKRYTLPDAFRAMYLGEQS
jgi:hypothetical protein